MDPEKPGLDVVANEYASPAPHDSLKSQVPLASTSYPYQTIPGDQGPIRYPDPVPNNHQSPQHAAYQAPNDPAPAGGAGGNMASNNYGTALPNHQQYSQPHSPPAMSVNTIQQPGQSVSGSNGSTFTPPRPKHAEDSNKHEEREIKIEEKSLCEAYILCLPLGFLGLHHFYLGRIGVGFLYFFTLGLFGIGWIVDWFRLPSLVNQTNKKLREDAEKGFRLYGGPYDELYDRSVWTAYLFWLPPIGFIGGHHYYLGRTGYGILYTLTMGLFGVGWFFDFCRIGVLTRRANKEIRALRSGEPLPSNPRDRMYLDDAYMLAFPLGFLGLHHFYMRRWVFGITYFLTFGCMGAGFVFDLVRLPFVFARAKRELQENKTPFHIDDAYVMWFPLGLVGMHHFYLRRWGWGLIYFFTFGLLGVGWLVDLCRIPVLVKNANTRREYSILNEEREAESRRIDYGTRETTHNPNTIVAYAYPLDAYGNPNWTQGVAWNGQGLGNPNATPPPFQPGTCQDSADPPPPYAQMYPDSQAQGGVINAEDTDHSGEKGHT